MHYFTLGISSIAGLLLNHVFTHPQSKLNNDILPALKSGVSLQRRMTYQRSIHLRNELRSVLECCYKLPHIKIKGVQICPYLEIKLKTKSIRVHHWLTYSILLIITISFGGSIFNNVIANGYFIGAIVQGLSLPDWKHIIYRR